jgi:hypothetical protein
MSGSSSRPHLRVVKAHDEGARQKETPKVLAPGRQAMLFSDASSFTLGFIRAGELDAARLTNLIEDAKPRLIFDLRPVPSFARGTIQRRAIFALFEKHQVEYFDVAGVLGVSARRDGLLNPALLIDAIQVNILRSSKGLAGPVFFFVDDELFNDDYFTAIANRLPHQDGRGWDIACWPNDPKIEEEVSRQLIFLSHANPEDNEIAAWFCSRLAAQGYQVWSDITRLIGGEVIWDTIEEAIRRRAAKVIVLLSKRGHQKPGLLDEVNVAIATERVEGLERFVIPVRIDDLPFTSVRANLARKNVIDGSNNLADALQSLLKVLREDGVPRAQSVPDNSNWVEVKPDVAQDRQWDVLFENKVSILRWPATIRKFRSSMSGSDLPFPNHPIEGGVVTFDNWAKVAQSFGGQVQKAGEATLSVQEWPASNDLVFSSRGEMHKALASLVRQGWNKYCASLGMLSYPLANRSVCWFLKNGALSGNKVRFLDQSGVDRSKVLVGHSPKRAVFWHFGIEARVNIADRSLRLVPHVVFSDDGVTPISSVDRQHALRRGFCRNWWNARWRDLLVALLAHMSRGEENISLAISDNDFIAVSARLHFYNATIEAMVNRHAPDPSNTQLLSFAEPVVAVGYGQTNDYPKEGLLQFGPVSFNRNPSAIRAGVVGTREGIELFQRWSDRFNAFRGDSSDGRNSIAFPGFEAVFGAKWQREPIRTVALSRTDVINAILLRDRHQAVYRTSGLFADAITNAVKSDDLNIDVWYVIIPDEVYLYGRPASRIPRAIAIATPSALGRHAARRFTEEAPSLFPEDNAESLIYDYHLDFHHQLKARLLSLQAVTQILRESSLATVTSSVVENPMLPTPREPETEDELEEAEEASPGNLVSGMNDYEDDANFEDPMLPPIAEDDVRLPVAPRRQMQDAASFAWNIGTTTFFKAGGRPWRVASARPGVCYIGLIFKREFMQTSRHACCGAQMFLDDSDGLVFKGAMGPWYSPQTGQFHLSRAEASRLISRVIEAYVQENKTAPKEIFIHGRTRFDENEWQGFCDAVDLTTTKLTAIRITRSNEFKLYSSGELAVKRGTALRLTPWLGLLWTSGYIPKLETYPGRETPNPLRIEIVRDSSKAGDIELVMRDIMVLTKMNFNSCIYADGVPVTMRFADAIGDVLVTAKDKDIPPLPFRYYI